MAVEALVRCYWGREDAFGDPQLRGTWGRVPFSMPSFEKGGNTVDVHDGGNSLTADGSGNDISAIDGGNSATVSGEGNELTASDGGNTSGNC